MWPGTCHLWCLLPLLPLLRYLVAIFDNICARCGDCRLPFALTRVVGGRSSGGWEERGLSQEVRLLIYIYISQCVCGNVCVCLPFRCRFSGLRFLFELRCLSVCVCMCACVGVCVCAHVCDCGADDCLWLD